MWVETITSCTHNIRLIDSILDMYCGYILIYIVFKYSKESTIYIRVYLIRSFNFSVERHICFVLIIFFPPEFFPSVYFCFKRCSYSEHGFKTDPVWPNTFLCKSYLSQTLFFLLWYLLSNHKRKRHFLFKLLVISSEC